VRRLLLQTAFCLVSIAIFVFATIGPWVASGLGPRRLFGRIELGATAAEVLGATGGPPDLKLTLKDGREVWWYRAREWASAAEWEARRNEFLGFTDRGEIPCGYLDVVVLFAADGTVALVKLGGEGSKDCSHRVR